MTFRALRIATSILFVMVGVLLSAWAAIAPYAKAKIGASDSVFGAVILCMGIGSVVSMQFAGSLMYKLREKTIAWIAFALFLLSAPLLAIATNALALAATLFAFGAAIGTLEILMNHQASVIEVKAKRPLMSGFHAWFSVGGFLGALAAGQLLELSLTPFIVVVLLLLFTAIPFLWAQKFFEPEPQLPPKSQQDTKKWFVLPKGSVAVAAVLCAVVFLAEGAILDWSSIFLVQTGKLPPERASLGYASFAAAMTLFRFTGDGIVKYFGRSIVLQAGSFLASLGLFLVAWSPDLWLSLLGFALVGTGAANIVPILFSSISQQRIMPPAAALTAMTTFGYAGILSGPAFIGWVSDFFGMTNALAFVGVLMVFVALLGRKLPLPKPFAESHGTEAEKVAGSAPRPINSSLSP